MSSLEERGAVLLELARASVAHGVRAGAPLPVEPADYAPELRAPQASFVTLRIHGALRGCTGSLQAARPLVLDVAQNAYRSAFGDPRFPPLAASELPAVSFHISLLSGLEPVAATREDALLASLRPGIDGLVLREAAVTATFLPAVWRSLPSPQEFLCELKHKAGLPRDYWSPTLRFERYTVEEVG